MKIKKKNIIKNCMFNNRTKKNDKKCTQTQNHLSKKWNVILDKARDRYIQIIGQQHKQELYFAILIIAFFPYFISLGK